MLDELFSETFGYLDNILGQYFGKNRDPTQIKKQLNQSFDAKHYKRLKDQSLRDFVNLDYSKKSDSIPRKSWIDTEFATCNVFDPAQLNLVILNSPLTYQMLAEMSKPKDDSLHKAEQADHTQILSAQHTSNSINDFLEGALYKEKSNAANKVN